MTTATSVAERRMHSTRLWGSRFKTPQEAVAWFGGVQAQDYGPTKWSLGQRIARSTDAAVERAFDAGAIVRTHVLRPTWHLVAADDLRWLLELTGPRVHAHNSSRLRQLDLDPRSLTRAAVRIERHLRGGRSTRKELGDALERDGISTAGQRLAYILMSAELEGVICSGGRRGKQHTYALLDERIPSSKAMPRDEAVAELTRRFFVSHGPATIKDFRWWSSLTVSDIRAGLEVNRELVEEKVDGVSYWYAAGRRPRVRSPDVRLLHGYDEFVVAYPHSRFVIDTSGRGRATMKARDVPLGVVIVDAQIAGHWKRTIERDSVSIEAFLHRRPSKAERDALQGAADQHGRFLELDAGVTMALL